LNGKQTKRSVQQAEQGNLMFPQFKYDARHTTSVHSAENTCFSNFMVLSVKPLRHLNAHRHDQRGLSNKILFRKKVKRLFASCVVMLIYYREKNNKEKITHNNDD